MRTSKQFFTELREDEEYYNCFMTSETFSGIDFELRQQIVVNSIRQKSTKFDDDETYRELVKDVKKAKDKLVKYEFEQNHNI